MAPELFLYRTPHAFGPRQVQVVTQPLECLYLLVGQLDNGAHVLLPMSS